MQLKAISHARLALASALSCISARALAHLSQPCVDGSQLCMARMLLRHEDDLSSGARTQVQPGLLLQKCIERAFSGWPRPRMQWDRKASKRAIGEFQQDRMWQSASCYVQDQLRHEDWEQRKMHNHEFEKFVIVFSDSGCLGSCKMAVSNEMSHAVARTTLCPHF